MDDYAKHGHLPRLAPEYYRGLVVVHWVMTVDDRRTGWLTPQFHTHCRETLLHTMVRYSLLSPAYCLTPDHAHFVWMGVNAAADLALAAEFFRRQTNPLLTPMSWQKECYDHVLREPERKRGAFGSICHYVLENPVRKGLVENWAKWRFRAQLCRGIPPGIRGGKIFGTCFGKSTTSG